MLGLPCGGLFGRGLAHLHGLRRRCLLGQCRGCVHELRRGDLPGRHWRDELRELLRGHLHGFLGKRCVRCVRFVYIGTVLGWWWCHGLLRLRSRGVSGLSRRFELLDLRGGLLPVLGRRARVFELPRGLLPAERGRGHLPRLPLGLLPGQHGLHFLHKLRERPVCRCSGELCVPVLQRGHLLCGLLDRVHSLRVGLLRVEPWYVCVHAVRRNGADLQHGRFVGIAVLHVHRGAAAALAEATHKLWMGKYWP